MSLTSPVYVYDFCVYEANDLKMKLPLLFVLLILGTIRLPPIHAQQASLVYRERETLAPSMGLLQTNGDLYSAVQSIGLFRIDTSTLSIELVSETSGSAGYQYNYLSSCEGDSLILIQTGFSGTRIYVIDRNGEVHEQAPPGGIGTVYSNVTTRDNGIVSIYSSKEQWLTIDCGRTWFPFDEGNRLSFLTAHAFFAVARGSSYHSIAQPELGSRFVTTPINNAGTPDEKHVTVLGKDSIMWIQRSRMPNERDSLCTGKLGDTTSKICRDNIVVENGAGQNINTDQVLVGTKTGRVFLHDSTGIVYEHSMGRWFVVDSVDRTPNVHEVITTGWRSVWLLVNSLATSNYYTVVELLDSLVANTHLAEFQNFGSQPRAILDPRVVVYQSSFSGLPTILVNDNGRGVSLNSAFSGFEKLRISPILTGYTDLDNHPVLVTWNDLLLRPNESGIGEIQSLNTRFEAWPPHYTPTSYQNSTTGLRSPYVGSDEVIFPGTQTSRFDRRGHLLGVLDKDPSTTITRLQDGRVAIANGMVIRYWSNGSITDSINLRALLCDSDSLRSGYISSLQTIGDSVVVALVNGLRIEDAISLEVHPLACGGVIRSTDAGKTWTQSNTTFNEPYFIGMVTTRGETVVASYTALVQDTLEPIEDGPQDEALTHRMVDRVVVRSTNQGLTWTEVYRTPSNRSFRLLGGNGIRLRDGRLLLITTDDILESTDDGLTWDFHISGIQESVNPISLFTDDAGSVIYYCTDKGLYKSETITSVEHEESLSLAVRHASTWTDHLRMWASSERRCVSLTNLMGEVVYCNASFMPSPGLYVAEVEVHNTRRRVPIIVLGE